uniref:Uncharacterized protein n=1 Tax=Mola mola TaxID=94237 RepID=A0A3Q3VNT9_MOLML
CFLVKALHHYWQAAAGGHRQAQYRHAKLLLTSRGQQSLEKLNTAIGLLEQSAAAGLTKVCLASVFSQELVRDRRKSVHYLRMAAESGDHTALLFLGQCFESGFGVRQNLSTAIEYYKQAARAGNKQAAVLRSIHSAPCFFVAERRISSLVSCAPPSAAQPVALPLLPHSWSTGSLSV